jgi:hypothetical protein
MRLIRLKDQRRHRICLRNLSLKLPRVSDRHDFQRNASNPDLLLRPGEPPHRRCGLRLYLRRRRQLHGERTVRASPGPRQRLMGHPGPDNVDRWRASLFWWAVKFCRRRRFSTTCVFCRWEQARTRAMAGFGSQVARNCSTTFSVTWNWRRTVKSFCQAPNAPSALRGKVPLGV